MRFAIHYCYEPLVVLVVSTTFRFYGESGEPPITCLFMRRLWAPIKLQGEAWGCCLYGFLQSRLLRCLPNRARNLLTDF